MDDAPPIVPDSEDRPASEEPPQLLRVFSTIKLNHFSTFSPRQTEAGWVIDATRNDGKAEQLLGVFTSKLSAVKWIANTQRRGGNFTTIDRLLPPFIIVRVNPFIMRDLALLRQLDHVDRWPISARPA
jgi:hypothetical protein